MFCEAELFAHNFIVMNFLSPELHTPLFYTSLCKVITLTI